MQRIWSAALKSGGVFRHKECCQLCTSAHKHVHNGKEKIIDSALIIHSPCSVLAKRQKSVLLLFRWLLTAAFPHRYPQD